MAERDRANRVAVIRAVEGEEERLQAGTRRRAARAAAIESQPTPTKPMIGFQAESSYLLHYGIARFLDDVQTRASVRSASTEALAFPVSTASASASSAPAAASPASPRARATRA